MPVALSVPIHTHYQHPLTQVNSAKNLQAKPGIHSATLAHFTIVLGKQGPFMSLACISKGKGLQQQA